MESLGVKTERRLELESLVQHERGVHARLRHADGRLEDLNVRWVVGCDGAHSAVREKTGTRFEGAGVRLSFFLGDLELEGPDAPEDFLSVHVRRGDVVFMGRISDKVVRMIVALHSEQEKDDHRALTVNDFQQAVDQVGVRVKIQSAGWTTPFRVYDRQARRYRIGNVFLAGDASHIHSPVGGQGMNTGIQDAANLAWKLAAVARGADESLLDSYEEERSEVGKALLRFTERGLKMASTTNPLLENIRDVFVPFVSGLKPVQRALTGFIAETAIEYRSSSIVWDFGGDGDLHSGERMPDLTLLNPGDQTTLLRDWTGAKHLALVVNGSNVELAQIRSDLPEADVMSVYTPQLDDEGIGLLGIKKKVVIVRPDGYVGFRGTMKYRSEWRKYALQDGLAPTVLQWPHERFRNGRRTGVSTRGQSAGCRRAGRTDVPRPPLHGFPGKCHGRPRKDARRLGCVFSHGPRLLAGDRRVLRQWSGRDHAGMGAGNILDGRIAEAGESMADSGGYTRHGRR